MQGLRRLARGSLVRLYRSAVATPAAFAQTCPSTGIGRPLTLLQQLTSLQLCHSPPSFAGSWQPSFSFAAQGAVSSGEPEEQIAVNQGNHVYAQKMHIRRRRDKPAKNRNAWKRAEKKAMLMRRAARERKKNKTYNLYIRDQARIAKWRAGAALWRGTTRAGTQGEPKQVE
mmetsp:Transcript_5341/g.15298  ORF Transcript_5341/g.15298 Transcript_5341/m.15298 type:complete len:171 (+) Transcript_5341:182-694(+)